MMNVNLVVVIISIRFKTIHDVFANEKKKVCFHDSLYGIMEREYPTNVDSFYNSSVNDKERLLYLQNDHGCDSVVISRYSLSLLSSQINSFCDSLYPLYDEDLFTQEVIIAISQTLGDLGYEIVSVMDTMASKNLYRDRHDEYMTTLSEGCEFKALNGRNGVAWESLFLPLVFSAALAAIAFTVGCMKYKNGKKSTQSESSSSQRISEPEVASLLDNDDDPNKFAIEVKVLHEESDERVMEQIIQSDESEVIKRINVDSGRTIN